MSVPEKEVKLLWGRAAGTCSNPGCRERVSATSKNGDSYLTGEMAHMVARNIGGPRADFKNGANIYENLILLCPMCHTKIDKSPDEYSLKLLADWKQSHELWIEESLTASKFANAHEMLEAISEQLNESYYYFVEYGPQSKRAQYDPASSSHAIWMARRLDTIIHNNRRIVNILTSNENLVDGKLKAEAVKMRDHALAYEQHAYDRLDGYPTFPASFAHLVNERLGK